MTLGEGDCWMECRAQRESMKNPGRTGARPEVKFMPIFKLADHAECSAAVIA
jgi:hypothetical protein